jgi:O-antigen/teichoic acid export membrane protein
LQSWAARGITTFSFLIVGLIIGPEGFGAYALVSSLIVLAEMLCEQSLSQALVQAQMKETPELSSVFWTALGCGFFFSCSFLITGLCMDTVFNSPEVPSLLVWAAICPIIIGSTAVPIGLLRREMDFKTLTKRTVLASGASSMLGVVLVVLGYGARGLIAQLIVYYLLGAIVLWSHCRWRPTCSLERGTVTKIAKLGLSNASSKFLDFAETRGIELAVGAMVGVHAMGIYAFANKVAQTAFQTLVSPVLEVVFVGIARGHEHLLSTLRAGQVIIATVPITGLFVLAASAAPLLNLAYGDRWDAAAIPVSILAIAYAVRSFLYCCGVALQAIGQQNTSLKLSTYRAAICVTLAILLLAVLGENDLVGLAYLFSAVVTLPFYASALARHADTTLSNILAVPKLSLWAFALSALPLGSILFLKLLPKDHTLSFILIAACSGVVFFALGLRLNKAFIAPMVNQSGDGRLAAVLRKVSFVYAKL